jgi:Poly(hydroxyalcanoate) granule associated protein (phasin)
MATKSQKKPAAAKKPAAIKRNVKSAAKTASAKTNPARKVFLAGLGAVNRAQDEAVKAYNRIATKAERLTSLTSGAAETLAKKANVYVREGQKIQSQAVSLAEEKAREAAKEVAALAKKSEQSFKSNVGRTINATVANAKEGVTQLEQVFETRVAKTLNTFGIPSSKNVRELQARMADLQKALNQLNRRGVRA